MIVDPALRRRLRVDYRAGTPLKGDFCRRAWTRPQARRGTIQTRGEWE